MNTRYLLDENLPKWWRREIIKHEPNLEVRRVGDPGCPLFEASDPEILVWCETHQFVHVTNNRKSLPGHLAVHYAAGGHIPGIIVVDPTANLSELTADLALIAGASFENEYQDRIRYLPIA
jgi:hypothetical protein